MKFTKTIAMLLAALLLCLAVCPAVSAESDYHAEQVRKFEEMKKSKISFGVVNAGLFAIKTSIVYGREVTGVAEDGSFILGPWKVIDKRTNKGLGGVYCDLPGTYINFAWSVDIVFGTDWPFSGVFYRDTSTPVKQLSVTAGGTVRMVDITLKVNNKVVYSESNCDSHSEWKP